MIRISSSDKEDIFNVNFKDLKEYTSLYKLVFDTKALADYTATMAFEDDEKVE